MNFAVQIPKMKIATTEDREKAINILYKAFNKTPGVLWVVKKDNQIQDRIKSLCAYCFDTVIPVRGVYFSSDEMGVSLLYRLKDKKTTFRDIINKAILIYKVIGINRIPEIAYREKYINKYRLKGDYLYFWMVGIDVENTRGIETMKEITYWAADLSKKLNIPILAETTLEKNKRVYERYGYEEYHRWKVPKNDFSVYFMVRYPK